MKIAENRYYHIYNRGNNKGLIFFERENYRYFLEKFKHYICPYADVFSYCLMPNHFHFFLKVNDVAGFQLGIKNFFISYTKSINQSYGRVGSLFQGRYKAKEVDSDSYFTRIIIYIHRNPRASSMSPLLYHYEYSSYRAYLEDKPTFLSKKEVLDWFGGQKEFILTHEG